MSRRLPAGRVTFAFVDVVGSTKTFAEHGEAFVRALAVLQERIARHTASAGGVVVKTEGDGAFLAFPSAAAAVEALLGLQDELAHRPDIEVPRLAVRAGAHTGDAVPVADDYVALAVNVAARVTTTAGSGQVVVSAATHAELSDAIGVCVGSYDLKDVADPVELWRVCGDDAPLRGSPSRRTNVRIPRTDFVGREQEVDDLRYLLEEARLVTLLGPGGLGKTRLVSEMVLRVAGGIEGGAWLVELAPLESGDQVPAAIGAVLGLASGDVMAIAVEVRRRGDVLLVMDNCEHLLDAVAELVGQLLDACPSLRIVCTSREALQVAGERVWRLPPLEEAERFELFTGRAWASGAVVPDDSAATVGRLCDALDGLPLAIELAAAHAGSTTLTELVTIAEHGTDDLALRGGKERQRSLDAVLAWSLEHLPDPRRSALLALSVLPGRFDAEMATSILGTIDTCETEALRPLARASLIDLDGESYRILDTIRHAARRRLADDWALAHAARLGLRAWAYDLAARNFNQLDRWDDVSSGKALALETALEQAMADGARGAGRLWDGVHLIAYHNEPSERLLALARRAVEAPLPADADDALCFTSALHVLRPVGQHAVPIDRLEEVSAAADRHGVSFAAANLHWTLALEHAERGDTDAARRHADAYASFAESDAANPVQRRDLHLLHAMTARADGDLAEALRHLELELQEARASGYRTDLEKCEVNVADALLDLGRAAEALPHAAEAVRLSPVPGPKRRVMLEVLARAQAEVGDQQGAAATRRDLEAELAAAGG